MTSAGDRFTYESKAVFHWHQRYSSLAVEQVCFLLLCQKSDSTTCPSSIYSFQQCFVSNERSCKWSSFFNKIWWMRCRHSNPMRWDDHSHLLIASQSNRGWIDWFHQQTNPHVILFNPIDPWIKLSIRRLFIWMSELDTTIYSYCILSICDINRMLCNYWTIIKIISTIDIEYSS